MNKKYKIKLTDNAITQLKYWNNKLKLKSLGEFIRQSIGLFIDILKYRERGYKLYMIKGNTKIQFDFNNKIKKENRR